MRTTALSITLLAIMGMTIGCGQSGQPEPARQVMRSPSPDAAPDATAANGTATPAVPAGGWATLSGRFVYAGDPPQPGFLSTGGKDAEVCDHHPIPDESLVVDAESGGIANVLIYARDARRAHESYEAAAADEVVFDQKNCVFLSHVLPLRVSQTLVIKNSDPIGHNVNLAPRGDSSINPLLAPNDEMRHSFSRQQSTPVQVSCNIHPWMSAYVIPRNDPYFAVSAEDGTFEIADLPAGEEIEFQVWHERGAGANGSLEAKPDWSQGRFRLTLSADTVEELGEIEVPPAAFR